MKSNTDHDIFRKKIFGEKRKKEIEKRNYIRKFKYLSKFVNLSIFGDRN